MQNDWWYYSAEIEPGRIMRGIYPDTLPMLPRMLLRDIDVKGMECLDCGAMEGLIPLLMAKRGATRVEAVDSGMHCLAKMRRLNEAHGMRYGFSVRQTAYDFDEHYAGGFDLVNLSGLLYHVVSPLMVLLGIRPLLKRNGLMIVSTNIIIDVGMYEEFNAHGRMQREVNTFFYPTIGLLDYWLRMLRLKPIHSMFMPHEAVADVSLGNLPMKYVFDKKSGYVSILCQATDSSEADVWAQTMISNSIESQRLCDWKRVDAQQVSSINYTGPRDAMKIVTKAETTQDSHLLLLWDMS